MVGYELLYDPQFNLETHIRSDGRAPLIIRVGLAEVKRAEMMMLQSKLGGLHHPRYLELIRGAPKREELLRALAHYPGSLIPASFVGHVRTRRIGGARNILTSLTSGADAPILYASDARSYRFSDHQFRVYCRLSRPTVDVIDALAKAHVDSFSLTHG
jgi:hypothetical protein